MAKIIKDAALSHEMNTMHLEFIKNDCRDCIVADVYYNISVLIINKDLLQNKEIEFGEKDKNKDTFLSWLAKTEVLLGKDYHVLDFSYQAPQQFVPFYLTEQEDEYDGKYFDSVAGMRTTIKRARRWMPPMIFITEKQPETKKSKLLSDVFHFNRGILKQFFYVL